MTWTTKKMKITRRAPEKRERKFIQINQCLSCSEVYCRTPQGSARVHRTRVRRRHSDWRWSRPGLDVRYSGGRFSWLISWEKAKSSSPPFDEKKWTNAIYPVETSPWQPPISTWTYPTYDLENFTFCWWLIIGCVCITGKKPFDRWEKLWSPGSRAPSFAEQVVDKQR